jgi:hypothetical protein
MDKKTELNLQKLLEEMRVIQTSFMVKYKVDDIWSNSKIFEIVIADSLDHQLIPGHSGSKDAKDLEGNEFEYKHFKFTSSNHSWTFNDYSDSTIESLNKSNIRVIFAVIDDTTNRPVLNNYFDIQGQIISKYLKNATKKIKNARKMINVSSTQIEKYELGESKDYKKISSGPYCKELKNIFSITSQIEDNLQMKNILTSNKFWELIVSIPLNHSVNSEQGGREGAFDAFDANGNTYEYKVSKNRSWNFQDISPNVLNKYLSRKSIVLAVVNKSELNVAEIYFADPKEVVKRLKSKLAEKETRFHAEGKELRRFQVSLSQADLLLIKATRII